jgi:epoxyqueuosine reductase
MPNSISDKIRARAVEEGFDVVRFASADAAPDNAARLSEFLGAGHHGEMDWMEQRQAWRADPRSLWPQARSVIVLGINYGPKDDPLAVLAARDKGAISVYARGDD